ncbi:MAG: protein translocase subunit SecF [Gemmatimonadaceae bacterium]|nr:protein translocase subunit SecF [Gemmatimonadaceae bacterium]
MIRIFHNTSYDFIKWWRHAAVATVVFIMLGVGSYVFRGGVNYSIEFTSGTLMQVRFTKPVDDGELRAALDAGGVDGAEIQRFGDATEYTIRAQNRAEGAAVSDSASTSAVATAIRAALDAKYGAGSYTAERTEVVGPRVGAELRTGAAIAMVLASFVTLVYLAFRFEWRFGLAAVISTAHDVLITLAFIKLFHIEVSLVVVGAILTLLGYSGNDTIIIFDRVRENLRKGRKQPLYDTLNESINETLPRSVLTHTTTMAATLALLLFAGEVLRPFAVVMTFGIFVATFSSIYVASPVLLWIERKFPRAVSDKAQVSRQAALAESAKERPARPAPSGAAPRRATTR